MTTHGIPNPTACIAISKRLARKFGLFVVTKSDGYLLYRENKHGQNTLVGKRKSPRKLLELVQSCARSE